MDSAGLVVEPLKVSGNPTLTAALSAWNMATTDQRTTWATAYADAIGAPAADGEPATGAGGDPAKVATGDDGPVPACLLCSCNWPKRVDSKVRSASTSSGNFYGGDTTKSLLLLSDGAYLEDQARAKQSCR